MSSSSEWPAAGHQSRATPVSMQIVAHANLSNHHQTENICAKICCVRRRVCRRCWLVTSEPTPKTHATLLDITQRASRPWRLLWRMARNGELKRVEMWSNFEKHRFEQFSSKFRKLTFHCTLFIFFFDKNAHKKSFKIFLGYSHS